MSININDYNEYLKLERADSYGDSPAVLMQAFKNSEGQYVIPGFKLPEVISSYQADQIQNQLNAAGKNGSLIIISRPPGMTPEAWGKYSEEMQSQDKANIKQFNKDLGELVGNKFGNLPLGARINAINFAEDLGIVPVGG